MRNSRRSALKQERRRLLILACGARCFRSFVLGGFCYSLTSRREPQAGTRATLLMNVGMVHHTTSRLRVARWALAVCCMRFTYRCPSYPLRLSRAGLPATDHLFKHIAFHFASPASGSPGGLFTLSTFLSLSSKVRALHLLMRVCILFVQGCRRGVHFCTGIPPKFRECTKMHKPRCRFDSCKEFIAIDLTNYCRIGTRIAPLTPSSLWGTKG